MTAATSGEFLRLFAALPIDPKIAAAIVELQNALQRAIRSSAVRWTRTDQLHLTLKFFGNVAVARVPRLREALYGAVNGVNPLHLRLEGLGCFPNSRRPYTLWLGVADDVKALQTLHNKLATATEGFGAAEEHRSFAPHLTIGRVDRRTGVDREITAMLQRYANVQLGEWIAGRVELIRSELKPCGSVYSTLEVCALSAKAPSTPTPGKSGSSTPMTKKPPAFLSKPRRSQAVQLFAGSRPDSEFEFNDPEVPGSAAPHCWSVWRFCGSW